jgi:Zn-dependent protease with chaperone function
MKIYVSQNNQQLGPYTREEVQDLIYRGEVQRSAMACPEGGTDWVPVDALLAKDIPKDIPPVAAGVPPPITIPLERLRDPKELTALTWLYVASGPGWLFLAIWTVVTFGLLLPIIGFVLLMIFVGEMWFVAYLKTNAVRVSEAQLPELNRVVQSCCQRLGMPCPEVYVMQHNVWNAFAAQVFGRRMVVLLSGAVDSILLKGDLQQLTWLIGHELGHHRAGHLDFVRKLANLGDWLVWVKLWYSRRAELTCDRIGLYCAGSLKASRLALLNATVGAQLAGKVNPDAAVAQWRQHSGEFFVKYRTLYATHPHLLARLDHLAAAAAELGIAL